MTCRSIKFSRPVEAKKRERKENATQSGVHGHAMGTGGALGREQVQHLFLSVCEGAGSRGSFYLHPKKRQN